MNQENYLKKDLIKSALLSLLCVGVVLGVFFSKITVNY